MTGDRARWQETAGVLAGAALAGSAVWWLHRVPAMLAPPAPCPGVLELAAAAMARAMPALPLGAAMAQANSWLMAAGAAVLVWVVARASVHWAVAGAIGVAAAALPVFDPSVSVGEGVAFLVAALTFLAFTAARSSVRWWRMGAFGVFVSAAIEPRLALALVPVGAWILLAVAEPHRRPPAVAGLVVAAVLVAVAPPFVAPLPGDRQPMSAVACLLPSRLPEGLVVDPAFALFDGITPYVFGLAALGAFASRERWRDRGVQAGALYAGVPVLLALWTGPLRSFALSPAAIALWVTAAVGLGELARACTTRRAGWIGAAFFVGLVPFAQVNAIREPTPPGALAEGHDRLTRGDVAAILGALPDASVLAIDDATTDVLLRASYRSWRGTGKTLHVVSGPSLEIPPAIPGAGEVYAFPWTARHLLSSGFQEVAGPPAAPLLTHRLRQAGACVPVPRTWRRIDGLSPASDLSVGSVRGRDEGPVILYAATAARPTPQSVDWPALASRGFNATVYDASGTGALARQMDEDAVPIELRTSASYVTRFEVWRTPGAPRILRVRLGVPAQDVVARLQLPDERHRLVVCPAY
ncbi:MAG: hypothetical protein IT184_00865 [Acidobacteria bacterium]|nr:hypothetical protein [Acidobacteriota bacterium]